MQVQVVVTLDVDGSAGLDTFLAACDATIGNGGPGYAVVGVQVQR